MKKSKFISGILIGIFVLVFGRYMIANHGPLWLLRKDVYSLQNEFPRAAWLSNDEYVRLNVHTYRSVTWGLNPKPTKHGLWGRKAPNVKFELFVHDTRSGKERKIKQIDYRGEGLSILRLLLRVFREDDKDKIFLSFPADNRSGNYVNNYYIVSLKGKVEEKGEYLVEDQRVWDIAPNGKRILLSNDKELLFLDRKTRKIVERIDLSPELGEFGKYDYSDGARIQWLTEDLIFIQRPDLLTSLYSLKQKKIVLTCPLDIQYGGGGDYNELKGLLVFGKNNLTSVLSEDAEENRTGLFSFRDNKIEWLNSINLAHPDISPDGKRVVGIKEEMVKVRHEYGTSFKTLQKVTIRDLEI